MWLIPYYRDWDSNRSIQKSRLVHEVCFLSGVSGFPGDLVLKSCWMGNQKNDKSNDGMVDCKRNKQNGRLFCLISLSH